MITPSRLLAVGLLLTLVAACASTPLPTQTPKPVETSAPTQIAQPTHAPSATTAATPLRRGTLVSVTSMSARRAAHAATALSDGRVLITGGFAQEGHALASAEIFDPATNTFSPTGDMRVGRTGHSATLLPDGRVLIAGGWGDRAPLASAELYDPATGQFTLTGSMAAPRSGHAAARLTDGIVLLVGGLSDGWTFLVSAELYDPATGGFMPTGSLATARQSHTLTILDNGQVLIAGGDQGRYPNTTVHSSAELYDPAAGTFTAAGDMTIPRHKHGAALLPDGSVLIVGGSDERDWRGRYFSSEIYHPEAGAFTPAASMNFARFKLADAIVRLKDGAVLVAGGGARAEAYSTSANSFDLVAGQMDAARFFSTATPLPDGRALIVGGYDQNIVATASAWVYFP